MGHKKETNRLFISWSGDNGKEIAQKLKEILENDIFDNRLCCFVSESDIVSGEDWWNKIKLELTHSSMGIVCITHENVGAPWIHFETGALIGNNIKVIPLLFNCNIGILDRTPLSRSQSVVFSDKKKFQKMIVEINERYKIVDISDKALRQIAANSHDKILSDLTDVFDRMNKKWRFSEKDVYPEKAQMVSKDTVFLSALMSTLTTEEYSSQRDSLLQIMDDLKTIGFSKVICPAAKIPNPESFDGRTKSIMENFTDIKQSECFVLIYEYSRPSSSLVELGYAIALGKKTVVFYKEELPFLIQKAGENIPHVHTVEFSDYEMIRKEIVRNKMSLFGKEENE